MAPASGLSSEFSARNYLKRLLIKHGFGEELHFRYLHAGKLGAPSEEDSIGDSVLAAKILG